MSWHHLTPKLADAIAAANIGAMSEREETAILAIETAAASEVTALVEQSRRRENGITVRDGVQYHSCGRKVIDCRQMNGVWWCEHVRRASEPEGRDTGLHRDSCG